MSTSLTQNPFYSLGLEKANNLTTDRLLYAFQEAQNEVAVHPSHDGHAYVMALSDSIALRGE